MGVKGKEHRMPGVEITKEWYRIQIGSSRQSLSSWAAEARTNLLPFHSIELASPRNRMAPSYRPYGGDAVVQYGGGERKVAVLWWVSEAEMKRRRRVAGYKSYAVEGKVKASIRRGIRWVKAKCSHILHR